MYAIIIIACPNADQRVHTYIPLYSIICCIYYSHIYAYMYIVHVCMYIHQIMHDLMLLKLN